MSTSQGIRHRLLTILLLGVVTSALSLTALVYLLRTSMSQRVDRAHDAVAEEVDRLAADPHALAEQTSAGIVGVRAGTWDESRDPNVPSEWGDGVREIVRASAASHAREAREIAVQDATLVLMARPAASGTGVAWAGFLVKPTPSLRVWQWIVSLLAAAMVLLVATAAYAMVTVNRGAAGLRASLAALAKDLSAPVPRPTVRELSDIADGIARLAENLAKAKKEEERLGRELARQERLAALGRVVAGVAHEVRNPLASIKLRLDLAAAGPSLPASVHDAIVHASDEVSRLDRLVSDLLIVAGRAKGPKKRTSLAALVRARVDALAPWSNERGVTIVTSGDASALLDTDSMARAVDNVLRNAIDASPPGQTVEAKVGTHGDLAAIVVSDRGVGVVSERVSELFEPFFTTKPDGMGLGLAISRAIARAHGGDLTYARDGDATRFELSVSNRSTDGEAAKEAAE